MSILDRLQYTKVQGRGELYVEYVLYEICGIELL